MKCLLPVLVCLLLVACARHEPEEFEIEGLDQPAVLEMLGSPKSEYRIDGKTLKDSMGPKPKLAQSMSDADKVEVWIYSVTDSRAAAIYFDDDGIVTEVLIFRTDVMY